MRTTYLKEDLQIGLEHFKVAVGLDRVQQKFRKVAQVRLSRVKRLERTNGEVGGRGTEREHVLHHSLKLG